MKYRTDVDGLRAVAVLPVVLFHAGSPIFSGGYVGVDVFFVISGYLITSLIGNEIRQGTFSIQNFYERRIRRIFPALFLMILVTAAASSLWLFPTEYKDFGQSVAAATLFGSNVLFFIESSAGYFGPAAEFKPLLHTWSLAVEEQFYILFPLLMVLMHRIGANTWRFGLGLLAVISFAVSVATLEDHVAGTFYLLPARAWELLVGSLLALGAVPELRGAWLSEAAAGIGLSMIAWSVFVFTDQTPFPGPNAMIPCIGAALIIHAGSSRPSTLVARFLSAGPMVFVGLISYSLYLWHWPLILFAKLVFPTSQSELGIWLAVAASFAFASFSLRFVETPIRTRRLLGARSPLFAAAALVMSVSVGYGAVVHLKQGSPERFGVDQAYLDGIAVEAKRATSSYRAGSCFLDRTVDFEAYERSGCLVDHARSNALLIGDSHAAHLYPGLLAKLPEIGLSQLTSSGCRARIDPLPMERQMCRDVNAYVFQKLVPMRHWQAIFVASQWRDADARNLGSTLEYLKKHTDLVVLIGPAVSYRGVLPMLLAASGGEGVERHRAPESFALDPKFRDLAARHGVHYISMTDSICPVGRCVTSAPDGTYLDFDFSHLTVSGSEWVVGEWRAHDPVILQLVRSAATEVPAEP